MAKTSKPEEQIHAPHINSTPPMKRLRIGAGAGYAGDRIEPAVELASHGALDYLVFECLAERTIALAQQAKQANPEAGYDALLIERFRAVLPHCHRANPHAKKIKIITNMGAANPRGAAKAVAALAKELGITGIKIAAIEGDDVMAQIKNQNIPFIERQGNTTELEGRIISANAYLGAAPLVEALRQGADIIITGRVGDPALFLAPMIYEFNWQDDDWQRLGKGTLIGHLLECAGQVTGGYFADPGYKEIANLATLGFPLAEVEASGDAIITKVEGSGGEVTMRTCTEQLLYEVHNPARYIQPDVVADFSNVVLEEIGKDRVKITGGNGHARTETLKVSIGYRDSFAGEGQISYAGAGALARAELALNIVEARLKSMGVAISELKSEIIGLNAVHRGAAPHTRAEPNEVRLRIIGRTETMSEAIRIGNEVETLWINGPAGGGGATKSAREIIAVASILLPRTEIHPRISYEVL